MCVFHVRCFEKNIRLVIIDRTLISETHSYFRISQIFKVLSWLTEFKENPLLLKHNDVTESRCPFIDFIIRSTPTIIKKKDRSKTWIQINKSDIFIVMSRNQKVEIFMWNDSLKQELLMILEFILVCLKWFRVLGFKTSRGYEFSLLKNEE